MPRRRKRHHTRASVRKDVKKIREAATRPMITRSAARAAARDPAIYAVFHTSELMEMILVKLRMKQLLLSQRVSRRWRDFIQKTPSIQRILFMKPEWPESSWDYRSSGDHFFMYKSLTRRPPNGSDHSGRVILGVRYNPLIFTKIEGLGDMSVFGRTISHPAVYLQFDLLSSQRGGSNGEESWRRMYLTQPPWSDLMFVLPDEADGPAVVNHNLAPSPKARHVAGLMRFITSRSWGSVGRMPSSHQSILF